MAEPHRPAPTAVGTPPLEVDLRGIDTIIWATGFRPKYPWLDPSLLDRKGQLVHDGGVLPVPGLYVVGLPFLRRRKSSFLDGVGPDAIELVAHLSQHLDTGRQLGLKRGFVAGRNAANSTTKACSESHDGPRVLTHPWQMS